jgi:hypothetical protein
MITNPIELLYRKKRKGYSKFEIAIGLRNP